jgi:hypothetical protein
MFCTNEEIMQIASERLVMSGESIPARFFKLKGVCVGDFQRKTTRIYACVQML